MATDRSLTGLVAQFVPLKINTSSPDWRTISRKYPTPGNTIPVVYVIRADGEKIFAERSSLSGDKLPFVLRRSLQNAGGILSDVQAQSVIKAVAVAKQSLGNGDVYSAVRAMRPLAKLGTLGNLQSYAKPILDANAVVGDILKQADTDRKEIESNLLSPETAVRGTAGLFSAMRTYSIFPTVKRQFGVVHRSASGNDELLDAMAHGKAIDKAMALSTLPGGGSKAILELERLAAMYQETTTQALIEEKIASLMQ
ncbi:MAG: hypothetical protein HOB73_04070 [Planctomycetaceae bacterium]|nr:hypothetical protein [Planctomycetaceae bacterium]